MAAEQLRYKAYRAGDGQPGTPPPILRARWYLRHAQPIGPQALILGRRLITTPEMSVGAGFLLWSHEAHTGEFLRSRNRCSGVINPLQHLAVAGARWDNPCPCRMMIGRKPPMVSFE